MRFVTKDGMNDHVRSRENPSNSNNSSNSDSGGNTREMDGEPHTAQRSGSGRYATTWKGHNDTGGLQCQGGLDDG